MEPKIATMELRWQQLNSAFAMAKDLELLQEDASEMGVFETRARLKAKSTNQTEIFSPLLAPRQASQELLSLSNNQMFYQRCRGQPSGRPLVDS